MSKLFRKDKSFNKKVAWLMVMLLLMSPFFDMTWVKRAPKAASGEVVLEDNITFTQSDTVSLSFADADVVKEEETLGSGSYVYSLNKNPQNTIKTYCVDSTTVDGMSFAIDVTANISVTDQNATGATQYTTYKIGYKVFGSSDTLVEEYGSGTTDITDAGEPDAQTGKVSLTSVSVPTGSTLAIYILPTLADTDGNVLTSKWTIQGTYKVIDTDAFDGINIGWYKEDGTAYTDEYSGEKLIVNGGHPEYVPNHTGNTADIAGKGQMFYNYVEADIYDSAADDAAKAAVITGLTGWSLSAKEKSIVADETKKYYGVVAYGKYDANGLTIYKYIRTDAVTFSDDADGPVIGTPDIKKGSGSNWDSLPTDEVVDGIYCVDGTENQFKYTFTVTDEGVGIKDVKAKINGLDKTATEISPAGTYEVTFSPSDISGVTQENPVYLEVTATDNLGNETKTSEFVDPWGYGFFYKESGLKVDYEIVDGQGNVVASGDNFYELLNNQLVVSKKLDASYKIRVTASTGENTITITGKYSDNGSETALASTEKKALELDPAIKRNETIVEFAIPEDVLVSKKYDNITITVTDGSETDTENIGSLLYDADKPVISAPDEASGYGILQESEDGVTWSNVSYDSNLHYADSDKKYRYVVKVTDDGESGINDNKIKWNTSKLTKLEDGYYAIDVTSSISDETALEVVVDAEDKAGNKADSYVISPELMLTFMRTTAVITLRDSSGKAVSTSEPIIAKSQYTLTVNSESGYPISKIEVTASDEVYASADIDTTNQQKNAYNRYIASYTFTLPANADLNDWLNNIKVRIYNEGESSPAYVSPSLYTVLYDVTLPRLYNPSTNEAISVEDKWYQSYTLSYKLDSGAHAKELYLNSANYKITNSVGDTEVNLIPDPSGMMYVLDSVRIPESASPSGTKITFNATDFSTNDLVNNVDYPREFTIKVDETNPKVDGLSVNGSDAFTAPITGVPTINATVTDNLTIESANIVVTKPDGTTTDAISLIDGVSIEQINAKVEKSYSLSNLIGGEVVDGSYVISVTVTDKSGRTASRQVTFKIDNTVPQLNLKVVSGTAGGKVPQTAPDGSAYDYYYSTDVGVQFSYDDENISKIEITDNGEFLDLTWSKDEATGKYISNMSFTSEGRHYINMAAIDKSGNSATEKSIEFVIDKTVPQLTTLVNGAINYVETMGTIDLQSNANIYVSVSDACEDPGDLNWKMIMTKPDQEPSVTPYEQTLNRSFDFGEEADYEVRFYAEDMANNYNDTRSVFFRIDKTAPAITVSGAADKATLSNSVALTITMKEAFWWDASGEITIYRKANDSSEEALLKTVTLNPTASETAVTETLSETGVYRIEVTAGDRVGHRTTTTHTVTVDKDAPVVILNGVNNYDVTDQTVEFIAEINDDFYTTKQVSITGTRTDITGKVNNITFSAFNAGGNPTTIQESFAEDGIYDITVTSTDSAGNTKSSTVHFTIDKTDPVIGDLSAYDDAVFTSFSWDIDLDELVSDLTVCDVRMYLNGSEYDGVSDIEDGSYTLLITAEDELGHYVEKSVQFVLDTKAPVFIVTGVEDGEIKNEAYNISVSLQLEEDTLETVTLNGKAYTIGNNAVSISVTEKGEYTLYMKACDDAGNETEQTINFEFGEEESNTWILIVVAAATMLLIGLGIFIAVKKNKR